MFPASYCLRWPACCQPCVHLREQPLLLLEHLQAFQPATKNIIGCQLPWANRKKSGIRVASEGKIDPRSGPTSFYQFRIFWRIFLLKFSCQVHGGSTANRNHKPVSSWWSNQPIWKIPISHHSPQPRHQMLGNEPEFVYVSHGISVKFQLEQTNWKIRPNIHTSQIGLTLGKGYCTDSFSINFQYLSCTANSMGPP